MAATASKSDNLDDNLYDGLYGDDLDDDFGVSNGTTAANTSAFDENDEDFLKNEDDKDDKSAKKAATTVLAQLPAKQQTTTPAAPPVKPTPTATPSSLPAKPTTAADNALSYSAQIAQQFSQYQQTPSQERQSASAPASGGTPDASRPVRPSEMKDEGKMFVGGLSWDTTDGTYLPTYFHPHRDTPFLTPPYHQYGLRKYFSEFGKVDACTIVRDGEGKSRGFAFLTFEDPASVNAVMIREHFLDGKSIDPKRAIPREEHLRNTRYFVGGLAAHTTSESMKGFFSSFGKVVDATVMVDRETGRSKGFGFVTFEDNSPENMLVGRSGLVLDEKQIEVKTAQPRSTRDSTRAHNNGDVITTTTAPRPITTVNTGGNGMGIGMQTPGAADPQQMNMLYQRMMGMNSGMQTGMGNMMGGQMGQMGQMGMGGMMGNPMMMGGMRAGMQGGMMGGGMQGGGMMGAAGNGMMGGMQNGMQGGMQSPMAMSGSMSPVNTGMGNMASGGGAMRLGMGPMGAGGMGGMGNTMNAGMGMGGMAAGMGGMNAGMMGGMAMGGMRPMGGMGMMNGMGMMGAGRGAGRGAGMAQGPGPARVMNRGQHSFHPYAR
ncbi:unnamed protein product [Peniophora sp. CBMAI 1063]|nr:unnamed protein product [Peniophora sp. CBMAI 1063]